MSNPFQEQLLKAGMVSKQQVQKANKEKHKKKKQQSTKKQAAPVDETKLKAKQMADEKAALDRELNRKKEQQARDKAVAAEIKQLITNNRIERSDACELAYNFNHKGKVRRIYIDAEMKQQIVKGRLGIAFLEDSYELVPKVIAEKIRQRDEGRIVLFDEDTPQADENDEYADYAVPDDLSW